MSRLTTRALMGNDSDPGRARIVNSINGKYLCFPGPATKENEWTVPVGKFNVVNLLGTHVIPIHEVTGELERDEAGSLILQKIAAVLTAKGEIAPPWSCLDVCVREGSVSVLIGEEILESSGAECEDQPCAEVDNIPTPPTPPMRGR